jgi:acyl-CoA thioesterase
MNQNIHGFFTLPGMTDRPYVYEVTHLSEGKSYCTRNVSARQPTIASKSRSRFTEEDARTESGKICFSCICSFKKDEKETFEGHQGVSVQERWKELLGSKNGQCWETAPGIDAPW